MLFFVFKQKTAYEMSISDWSSDVCSSDLEVDEAIRAAMPRAGAIDRMEAILRYALRCATYEILARIDVPATTVIDEYTGLVRAFFGPREIKQIGRASCRERGCQYVEISVVAESLKQQNK